MYQVKIRWRIAPPAIMFLLAAGEPLLGRERSETRRFRYGYAGSEGGERGTTGAAWYCERASGSGGIEIQASGAGAESSETANPSRPRPMSTEIVGPQLLVENSTAWHPLPPAIARCAALPTHERRKMAARNVGTAQRDRSVNTVGDPTGSGYQRPGQNQAMRLTRGRWCGLSRRSAGVFGRSARRTRGAAPVDTRRRGRDAPPNLRP